MMRTKSRENIIAAADRLFNERGIQVTSLADIATAARVSKGTLFYHFQSKDDLILEIATQHIELVKTEVLSLIDEKAEIQPLATLAFQLVTRVLEAKHRNHLHLYLVEESINRSPDIREALNSLYNEWIGIITQAIEPWIGKRAGITAQVLLALIDGLVIQKTLEVSIENIEGLLRVVFPEKIEADGPWSAALVKTDP
ncbi:TetR/AcrR family transcriptional regulator [Reinekea sp. G2M2-21]|uniref:TetR/AcrR family transcriptional regulator n=1 Tax=Reinekea sp. G2M2-21 TaxID=2788942 RepID=UPI0018A911F7|nr:TetR/AcrR family transcriptional regulator [Reinekea sp. G2M2-21]